MWELDIKANKFSYLGDVGVDERFGPIINLDYYGAVFCGQQLGAVGAIRLDGDCKAQYNIRETKEVNLNIREDL